jgi:hypothetical protein
VVAGLICFRKMKGKGRPRKGSLWNLGNTNPFSFHKTKAARLFDLFLELVDLKSIQLLGSHID